MIKRGIQYGIIAIFLALIIQYFRSHTQELEIFLNISAKDFGMLLLFTFFTYITYSSTILLLLQKLGLKGIRYFDWFRIFIVSRFFNFHLTQGANIYRSYKLKKSYQFTYTNSIQTIIFLTWFYVVTTLLFCIAVIMLFAGESGTDRSQVVPILMFILLVVAAGPVFLERIIAFFPVQNLRLAWYKDKLSALTQQCVQNAKDARLMTGIIFLSGIHFTIFLALIRLSFQAINVPIAIGDLSLFTALLMVSKYVNIVPGNIGVTEYLCGYLSATLGGDLGQGIVVSGIIRMSDYILVCGLGVIFTKTLLPRIEKNEP